MKLRSLLLPVLMTSAAVLHAGTVAYQVPAGTAGNQNFDGNLGMDFNVRAPAIRVTQIGAFDSGGDGINGTITAGVFNRTTGTQVGTGATFNGSGQTLVDGSRFAAPSGGSFVLTRGFQGTIVAQGYNAAEMLGNAGVSVPPQMWTTNGGPGNQIAFTGLSRWGLAPFGFPANIDGGPANRYAAGTFEFEVIPVAGIRTALWTEPGMAGNQNYGGPLGMDFTVSTPIVISELGVFDDLGNGIGGTLAAEIWTNDGSPTLLASAAFDSASPGTLDEGSSRFKTITSLVLSPGNYTILGRGFSDLDLNGNVGANPSAASYIDDSGGAIQFVGTSRFGAVGAGFPGISDQGPANRYYSGTFRYDIIPEPGSGAVLISAGLVMLAVRRRR
jgi:hypothetical protein